MIKFITHFGADLRQIGHLPHLCVWIIVSLMENNKEDMIDSPETLMMTRQWKRKLHKQITVFRQIMLDIGK